MLTSLDLRNGRKFGAYRRFLFGQVLLEWKVSELEILTHVIKLPLQEGHVQQAMLGSSDLKWNILRWSVLVRTE